MKALVSNGGEWKEAVAADKGFFGIGIQLFRPKCILPAHIDQLPPVCQVPYLTAGLCRGIRHNPVPMQLRAQRGRQTDKQ